MSLYLAPARAPRVYFVFRGLKLHRLLATAFFVTSPAIHIPHPPRSARSFLALPLRPVMVRPPSNFFRFLRGHSSHRSPGVPPPLSFFYSFSSPRGFGTPQTLMRVYATPACFLRLLSLSSFAFSVVHTSPFFFFLRYVYRGITPRLFLFFPSLNTSAPSTRAVSARFSS